VHYRKLHLATLISVRLVHIKFRPRSPFVKPISLSLSSISLSSLSLYLSSLFLSLSLSSSPIPSKIGSYAFCARKEQAIDWSLKLIVNLGEREREERDRGRERESKGRERERDKREREREKEREGEPKQILINCFFRNNVSNKFIVHKLYITKSSVDTHSVFCCCIYFLFYWFALFCLFFSRRI
jgi:hypothetical protein